jgi:hypothetical protein
MNLLALESTLLCAILIALCIRSYFTPDWLEWSGGSYLYGQSAPSTTPITYHSFGISLSKGELAFQSLVKVDWWGPGTAEFKPLVFRYHSFSSNIALEYVLGTRGHPRSFLSFEHLSAAVNDPMPAYPPPFSFTYRSFGIPIFILVFPSMVFPAWWWRQIWRQYRSTRHRGFEVMPLKASDDLPTDSF